MRHDGMPGGEDRGTTAGQWVAYGLLVLAFITGGSSQRWGLDDFVVRGLAVPVAAWALWTLFFRQRGSGQTIAAVATAVILSLLPLLQVVPLPADAWNSIEPRAALAGDLGAVGVEKPVQHWTLAPKATWRAWAATLPGLACFLAVLAFVRTRDAQRALLRLVVALSVASMVLGIVQMGLPQDSLLNPFPEWHPLFRGVFAHFNHQGTSAAIGMMVALALALGAHARHRSSSRRTGGWEVGLLAFAAAFLLVALPLTTSRAAVTLAVVGLALVPLGMGVVTRERLRRWPARMGVAATLGVLAVGLAATAGWMQVDDAYELRAPMRAATAALANAHSPFGVGAGAFVPAFEQAAPDALFRDWYINHAHNEYLHWWAELGWAGFVAMVLAAALLVAGAWRAARVAARGHRDIVVACIAGTAMLFAHSVVEYPLRTTSLLAVGAALGACLFATVHVRIQPPHARLQ